MPRDVLATTFHAATRDLLSRAQRYLSTPTDNHHHHTHTTTAPTMFLQQILKFLALKRYQYEVTFSLYMLTPVEKVIFSTFHSRRRPLLQPC